MTYNLQVEASTKGLNFETTTISILMNQMSFFFVFVSVNKYDINCDELDVLILSFFLFLFLYFTELVMIKYNTKMLKLIYNIKTSIIIQYYHISYPLNVSSFLKIIFFFLGGGCFVNLP
jgi:hypothetical protein